MLVLLENLLWIFSSSPTYLIGAGGFFNVKGYAVYIYVKFFCLFSIYHSPRYLGPGPYSSGIFPFLPSRTEPLNSLAMSLTLFHPIRADYCPHRPPSFYKLLRAADYQYLGFPASMCALLSLLSYTHYSRLVFEIALHLEAAWFSNGSTSRTKKLP